MSEAISESLSACIDGETGQTETHQLIDSVLSDEELRQKWRNYHSVSSVLRGERLSASRETPDWVKLADALDDDADVIPFRNPRTVLRRNFVVKSASVVGIAAALVLAVFVLIPRENAEDQTLVATNEREPEFEVQSTNPTTPVPPIQTATFVGTPSPERLEQQRRHLMYMFKHDKNVSVSKRTPLPFARVVSRTAPPSAQ